MKTNKEIKQLFENMNVLPMFEIDLSEYINNIDSEYAYCYINYDEQTNMLQYGGVTNCGFYCEYEFEYDKYFSLDENLQSLLELFIKNSIKEYQDENKTK